jgi:division protein CdvB (Snf7/Vps24/ESCRT-III family)
VSESIETLLTRNAELAAECSDLRTQLAAAQKIIAEMKRREGRLREACEAAKVCIAADMDGSIRLANELREIGMLKPDDNETLPGLLKDIRRQEAILTLTAALAATGDGGGE